MNGFTNDLTATMVRLIRNDPIYEAVAISVYSEADLRDYMRVSLRESVGSGPAMDILNAAFAEVNWVEVYDHFKEECEDD